MKATPLYSGNKSQPFWKAVHRLPEPHRWYVYAMGCILQDTEERVLRALADARKRARLK